MPKLLLPILMAVMLAGCGSVNTAADQTETQQTTQGTDSLPPCTEDLPLDHPCLTEVAQNWVERPWLEAEERETKRKRDICYSLYNSTGSDFDYWSGQAYEYLTVNDRVACARGEL